MIKSKFLYFLFLCVLLPISACSGDDEVSVLNDKPVFSLSLEARLVRYRIYLNNILVTQEKNPSVQTDTSFPLNHWMKSGKNVLKVIVFPNEAGEPIATDAVVNANIRVENFGSDQQYSIGGVGVNSGTYLSGKFPLAYRLSEADFKQSDSGSVSVSNVAIVEDSFFEGVREYEVIFDIPSNLPEWKFFSSDNVADSKTISDAEYYEVAGELNAILSQVQMAVSQGKVDEALDLFAERNAEIDLAQYKEPGATREQLKSVFVDDFPSLTLRALENAEGKPTSEYISEPNGKLGAMFSGGRRGALGGDFKDGAGSMTVPVMFRRENGKWIITR